MVAVPAAIVFMNDDLVVQVKNWIIKQLHIDLVFTGDEFDALVEDDVDYPNKMRGLNRRILVIRDFRELDNRAHADVVVFVKNGVATVEKNKFGPPNQTFLVRKLHWGQLCIFKTNL
jgi:CO dehydrogenase/acetyl-CoA synthase epsilon subunit